MTRECRMQFELLATDGAARRGVLRFPRGEVNTPAFMPVGTYGTVKAMKPHDIEAIGAEILLGNTFHLMLRPRHRSDRAFWQFARLYAVAKTYPH
jgi:queuine tRNA-ribosyltransferase